MPLNDAYKMCKTRCVAFYSNIVYDFRLFDIITPDLFDKLSYTHTKTHTHTPIY